VAAGPAATDVETTPGPAVADVREHSWQRLALALLLLPLAVSAALLVVRYGSSYHAVSDNAINELRTCAGA
jgi:hypothetical protein